MALQQVNSPRRLAKAAAKGHQDMKLSDINPGDKLVADNGFSCCDGETIYEVHTHLNGEPYIKCRLGYHYLSGQLDSDGNLIGFKKTQQ